MAMVTAKVVRMLDSLGKETHELAKAEVLIVEHDGKFYNRYRADGDFSEEDTMAVQ